VILNHPYHLALELTPQFPDCRIDRQFTQVLSTNFLAWQVPPTLLLYFPLRSFFVPRLQLLLLQLIFAFLEHLISPARL